MSIYASLPAPNDDEHADGCAAYVEHSPNIFELRRELCDCGQLDAPLHYYGSHVLPESSHARRGHVDIALIPAHVRYYREHPDGTDEPWEPPEPFLRFGVNGSAVVLTRRNVQQIHDTLTDWLSRVPADESEAA